MVALHARTAGEPAPNPAVSLARLRRFAGKEKLEQPKTYRAALTGVLAVLQQETGLIQLQDLPTIIIPDLHSRRSMLIDILCHRLEHGPYAGRQLFDLLRAALINIVCVGDIVHSEERSDWVINENGDWTPELLQKEMIRSLGAATLVMYLKMQYSAHFHCLRGNHDDITGELTKDFRKFVGLKFEHGDLVFEHGRPVVTANEGESIITRNWILKRGRGWGLAFLDLWGQFDRALPVFAQGSNFVVSHYLPGRALSKEEIADKNRSRDATMQLTSLDEKSVQQEAMDQTLENLGLQESVLYWFHGHRNVSSAINEGKYAIGPGGRTVRLNNPKNHVFAYVPGPLDQRLFDPTIDVYIKKPAEPAFHTSLHSDEREASFSSE